MDTNSRGRRRFSKGRWAIERERARIDEPAQPPAVFDPAPIGAGIDSVLKGLRLAERDWQSELLGAWVQVAGPVIARHARPGRVVGDCLTVYVDSAAWMSEISRSHRGPLLQALQRRFGAGRIASIRLMPDPDGPATAGGRPAVD